MCSRRSRALEAARLIGSMSRRSTSMNTVAASTKVLATFPSKSNPSKSHEVRLGKDGVVYCTCPAWRFQKLTPSCRCCKHTKATVASMTHAGKSLAA